MAIKTLLFPLALAGALFAVTRPALAERPVVTPPAALSLPASGTREVAIFGGGCFWGVEGVFERVRGVSSAVSGYAGGNTPRPTYVQVTSGTTGHAEVVKVIFDPRVVRYTDLLQIYFSVIADPTQLNRQGPDTGTQYRTALFPTSAVQAKQARAYLTQLKSQRVFERPIVTTLESARAFTPAEAYHQDFMRKNPAHPYIVMHDRPKVAALKRLFPARYRG